MAKLSLRVDLEPGGRIGPGKIALLETIAAFGSISAGARAMRMSYKRAWDLVEEMNALFGRPVVAAKTADRGASGRTRRGRDKDGRRLTMTRRVVSRRDEARAQTRIAIIETFGTSFVALCPKSLHLVIDLPNVTMAC